MGVEVEHIDQPDQTRETYITFPVLDVPPSLYRPTTKLEPDYRTGLSGIRVVPPSEWGAPSAQIPSTADHELPGVVRKSFWRLDNILEDQLPRLPELLLQTKTNTDFAPTSAEEWQRWKDFERACIAYNTLATNGRDLYDIATCASVYQLIQRYGFSEETLASQAVLNGPVPTEWSQHIRDIKAGMDACVGAVTEKKGVDVDTVIRFAPALLAWIVAQEEHYLNTKQQVPPELQILGTSLIHLAVQGESPPTGYVGAHHVWRTEYARSLVLARDAHMRLVAPYLAQQINRTLTEVTGIGRYGHRYNALAHQTPLKGLPATIISTCLHHNSTVTGATWDDPRHTLMYESSAKGWWGILDDFLIIPSTRIKIESLADRLRVQSQLSTIDQYRFRLATSMVYADAFDSLVRDHSDDPEVLSLIDELRAFVRTTPDHAGVLPTP